VRARRPRGRSARVHEKPRHRPLVERSHGIDQRLTAAQSRRVERQVPRDPDRQTRTGRRARGGDRFTYGRERLGDREIHLARQDPCDPQIGYIELRGRRNEVRSVGGVERRQGSRDQDIVAAGLVARRTRKPARKTRELIDTIDQRHARQ
jgi:hypothetical protein